MELIDIIYNVLFLMALFLTGFFALGFILSRANRKEFERKVDEIRLHSHLESLARTRRYAQNNVLESSRSFNNKKNNRNFNFDRSFYIPTRDHSVSGQYFYN